MAMQFPVYNAEVETELPITVYTREDYAVRVSRPNTVRSWSFEIELDLGDRIGYIGYADNRKEASDLFYEASNDPHSFKQNDDVNPVETIRILDMIDEEDN